MKSKFLSAVVLGIGLCGGCAGFEVSNVKEYNLDDVVVQSYWGMRSPEGLSSDELRDWKSGLNGSFVTPRARDFISSFLEMSVNERKALLDSSELSCLATVLDSDFRDYFLGKDWMGIYSRREAKREEGFGSQGLYNLFTRDFALIDLILNGDYVPDKVGEFPAHTLR